jgi:hypothetical protein
VQPGLLILIHQLDHRLAAVAGLGVHVLKQQQRGGASAVKHFAPFGLAVQQRGGQQRCNKRQ